MFDVVSSGAARHWRLSESAKNNYTKMCRKIRHHHLLFLLYTPSSATDPTPRLELSWQQKARQSHGHRNVLKKKWKSYNCRVVGHQSEVDSFVIATYQH